MVFLLYILQSQKVISKKPLSQLNKSVNFINKIQKHIIKESERLAKSLYNKLPILYASDGYESVLIRWRQQINENAKQLCWHHVISEMNHNEIVGWRENDDQKAVLFIRNADDFKNIQIRMDINKETILQYTEHVLETYSSGKNKIEQMMYLIHLGDWLTCALAALRNFDPVEVKVIDALKLELNKRKNS